MTFLTKPPALSVASTHKDLHVVAVVHEHHQVLGCQCSPLRGKATDRCSNGAFRAARRQLWVGLERTGDACDWRAADADRRGSKGEYPGQNVGREIDDALLGESRPNHVAILPLAGSARIITRTYLTTCAWTARCWSRC
jgi:hypothetical protein